MPYIKAVTRKELEESIDQLATNLAALSKDNTDYPGNLNYTITSLILKSLKIKFGNFKYWQAAMVDGVLSNIGREFYRKKCADYEEEKIKENGDLEWK